MASRQYTTPLGRMLYVRDTGSWRYQRPIIEQDRCTRCGLCYIYCPTGAISKERATKNFSINYNFCKGCGICAEECPPKAITLVEER